MNEKVISTHSDVMRCGLVSRMGGSYPPTAPHHTAPRAPTLGTDAKVVIYLELCKHFSRFLQQKTRAPEMIALVIYHIAKSCYYFFSAVLTTSLAVACSTEPTDFKKAALALLSICPRRAAYA